MMSKQLLDVGHCRQREAATSDTTTHCQHTPRTSTPVMEERRHSHDGHGHRLVCFRPRHRFTTRHKSPAWGRTTPSTSHVHSVICGCPQQLLQCRIVRGDEEEAASIFAVGGQQGKRKKWMDKFESHDWEKHPWVCQKWKETQKKFPSKRSLKEMGSEAQDQDETSQKLSPSKAGVAVKAAFSNLTNAAEVLLLSGKFEGLLRNGVPPQTRGQVWWLCSGAAEKKAGATEVETYMALVKRIPLLSKRAALEIEKDLPRTFPNEAPKHGERDLRPSSMAELRRVLQAYCLRNPVVGYCQSMNFIAAVLLQHMEEEEAFWVLAAVVEDLIPQFHTKNMIGSRAEQRVFTDLVQQKLPALDQHMQYLGVDLEPFTLKWFLCLFLNTLPLEPVLRVWDLFFCEGSHILLRVGLTLLKLVQPRILACDDAVDVYEMFKFSHATLFEITAPHRAGLFNRDECVCDTLLRLATDRSFIGPIAFDSLHELRHLYRNEIATELKNAAERRASRQSSDHEVDEDEYHETRQRRLTEAEHELNEYDFVEEFAYHCGDVSPSKHIHFCELYDCGEGAAELYVDVDYDGVADPPANRV